MYPIVRGRTDKVHGDRLLASPAANTRTYERAVTPCKLPIAAVSRACRPSNAELVAIRRSGVADAVVALGWSFP
jgi:hypothetical protein